jgi:hypothetical protein
MSILVEIGDTFANNADPEVMVSIDDITSPGVYELSDGSTATIDDLTSNYTKLNIGVVPKVSITETIEPIDPNQSAKTVHLHNANIEPEQALESTGTLMHVNQNSSLHANIKIGHAANAQTLTDTASQIAHAFSLLNDKKKIHEEHSVRLTIKDLMSDKDMSNFAQLYDVSNAELTKIVENILHNNAANVISQLASAIVNKNVPIVNKATNDDLASS